MARVLNHSWTYETPFPIYIVIDSFYTQYNTVWIANTDLAGTPKLVLYRGSVLLEPLILPKI